MEIPACARTQRRLAELMPRFGHLMAKSAREVEMYRLQEMARLAKAQRAAEIAEQNRIDSDERAEGDAKRRLAIRDKLRFGKRAQNARASHPSMVAMTAEDEVAVTAEDKVDEVDETDESAAYRLLMQAVFGKEDDE